MTECSSVIDTNKHILPFYLRVCKRMNEVRLNFIALRGATTTFQSADEPHHSGESFPLALGKKQKNEGLLKSEPNHFLSEGQLSPLSSLTHTRKITTES